MPYYSGDYYTGDYYEGDPFWGGVLGLGRRLAGLGGRLFKRGRITPPPMITAPVGIAGGSLAGAGMAITRTTGALARRAAGVVSRHPVLSAAGAAGTIGAIGGMVGGRVGMEPAAQRGMHISRKTGRLVRNRRMRVTNPKALRRAIRRATGFAKLARRVLHFTSPRAPRGRAVFKKRRRARV